MKFRALLGVSALASTLALAFPANAQTTSDAQAADPTIGGQTVDSNNPNSDAQANEQDAANRDVVVTGSRIRRPNDESPVPITTLTAAELGVTARTAIGDVLNDLPQLQSTYSQANSTRFLGTAGLNLLDLRGLGTQRTLVLVNGRRHVGSDILVNAVSVDINTIPTDLIKSVDLVTGGNSATYGSDALAGVVNFILRDDFEGLQVRGQGAVSSRGDAGSYFTSVLGGKNFAEGRGNIAVNLEYSHQNELYASQRDYLRQTDGFVAVDSDAAGRAAGQRFINYDGIPDSVFFRDVRVGTFSAGGTVAFASPSGACGRDNTPTAAFGNAGRPFTCNYLFQPGGSLAAQTGSRVGLGTTIGSGTAANPISASSTPTGAFIGGNGDTRREGQLLQILPRLDRYSANLIGHFTVSDAFVPFIEAKYSRTDSLGQGSSGPAFFTGSTLDAFYERPRLDNPFLSADARATLTAQALGLANAGFNPTNGQRFQATSTLTAAQVQANTVNAINSGSYRFILRKNLTDLGVRTEEARRETFRIVGGVRGDFNDDWNYELSVNYGQFNERTKVLGNLNTQRALLALDAVRNSSGQIVCGSQIDPSRAYDDITGNAATLAADIAACQPLNPFGVGSVSQAAKNYVLTDTVSRGKITQLDVMGYISGDLSQLFTLPGGDVGFSLGGEYRRETAFYQQDPLVEQGYTFYNAIAKFAPPSFEVKEAFGEVRIPLLKDLPLIQQLAVDGAARVSDYKGSAGTVWAYSGNVVWAPVRDLRFRANYSRSVRAPNLADLYSPQSQNFASVGDPCSARNIAGGTQYRAANCAAAGIPSTYDYVYAQTLEILSGGNPDLNVEKSDSYTYGVQFQPSFIPGLSISADYYNIKVNDVITAPSAQGIINSCYDSPTAGNQFCQLFQRVPAGQTGPNGEEAYRIIEGSLRQTLLNYAKLQVRGIDFALNYDKRIGNVLLTNHIIYTHVLQNDSFIDPTQPGYADTVVGELGAPRDQVNWNIGADFGTVFANVQMRYLTKQSVGAIENHTTFQGREPQNMDDYDIPFYPDVFYMDLKFGVNITKFTNFYLGVDNVTDRLPPLGATGIGAGSGIFEPLGRKFYAGFQARF
ncbi:MULTISPECIES: TonB-dependent receptor domain-containing protein [Sphingomonas]|uniref:TonB-dependent receptor domain-containing protein n=1 Tax=Sphingomonas TaxID=13687 RepID=UPI00254D1A9C|nr:MULTISPECIES: TonB-dependent receptor [Sphingomonas]MDK8184879.1 TonB-dependent receptor [Sphingomonas zeae]MDK8215600.1 TonB-dependent receptor [Sphingomonas sp. UMB7805-LC452B]